MSTEAIYNHIVMPALHHRKKQYLESVTDIPKIIEVVRSQSIIKGDYAFLRRYYEGIHDINIRGFEDPYKPNNRVAHNFPKIIVDTASSYFTGKPATVQCSNPKAEKELLKVNRYNQVDDVNYELDKISNMFGHAYEIHWIDKHKDKTVHRFKYVSPENAVMFFSPDMHEEPIAFVIWKEFEDSVTKLKYFDIQLYDDTNATEIRVDRNTSEFTIGKSDPHKMPFLPAIEFLNNEERKSSFETVIPLIDAYNKVVSDTVNDVEYWADSYLLLRDMSGTDSEDVAEMKKQRVMLVDGSGDASFLTKQTNDRHLENIKDRLTQDIHKFSQVPNLHDEQFASNLSGVAIKWKMKDLEDKTAQKERKFTKAMEKRHELILGTAKFLSVSEELFTEDDIIDITFIRNIPANIIELAELAAKIPPNLFSNETLRAQFPIKYNEEQEKKRIEDEQKSKVNAEMGSNPFLTKKEGPPQNIDPKSSPPSEPPKDE